MGKKLSFIEVKDLHKFLNDLLNRKDRLIFNFLNSHDLYFFAREPKFRKTFDENPVNFIDGFVISFFLSLKNFRYIKRLTGSYFTKYFFSRSRIVECKKQLFIGLKKEDLYKLIKKYPSLKKNNLFYYNPPYIKEMEFSEKEIEKISKMINLKKINYVWVGLGCPKQNILTKKLFKNTRVKFFFNVGAALDFLLEKKKRAPKIVRSFGIEWLYRFITDFNHSKKKVWRSFISILYLNKMRLVK